MEGTRPLSRDGDMLPIVRPVRAGSKGLEGDCSRDEPRNQPLRIESSGGFGVTLAFRGDAVLRQTRLLRLMRIH